MVKEHIRKARRKVTAEVFTPKPLVYEMLKKIPLEVWKDENKTFIDPSCGNGNFLIEILRIKLKLKHNPLKAISTIYGIDIMYDNTEECKHRLFDIAFNACPEKYKTEKVKNIINKILNKNIKCNDALTYNFEFKDENNGQI